jgi:ArsR family transcriptional regulator, arsenate/arsenite/antimonite-responsive transcriptional repressor / arsenate reductase (thioredoxin)
VGASLESRARVHAALGDPARLAIVDALMHSDAAPGELARVLDLSSNLIAHHLNVLERAGVIRRARSEGDGRRAYVRLRPETMGGMITQHVRTATRIVFVCTHNSARSQLAAALWATSNPIPVTSAGTEPADRIHPRTIRVANRHGLAVEGSRTTHVADVLRPSDLVVTVCDNAHERLGAGLDQLHWSVPDPALVDTDDVFEAAFADIAARIGRLALALAAETEEDLRHD